MAINLPGLVDQVVTLLDAVANTQRVSEGTPETPEYQIELTVGLGAVRVTPKATGGLIQVEAEVFVTLYYRVEGAETATETALATLVEAIIRAVMADRTLGGLAQSVAPDTGLAGQPEYADWAGSEYRRYPLVILAKQSESINPYP